jgi:hypothetical protein
MCRRLRQRPTISVLRSLTRHYPFGVSRTDDLAGEDGDGGDESGPVSAGAGVGARWSMWVLVLVWGR